MSIATCDGWGVEIWNMLTRWNLNLISHMIHFNAQSVLLVFILRCYVSFIILHATNFYISHRAFLWNIFSNWRTLMYYFKKYLFIKAFHFRRNRLCDLDQSVTQKAEKFEQRSFTMFCFEETNSFELLLIFVVRKRVLSS